MASSSTHDHYHQQQQPFPTAAPPPTPSTTLPSTSDSAATDLLSRLLHRLPPSLSNSATTPLLLRRRSSLAITTTTTPPAISFTDLKSSILSNLPIVSELGFFQLTNHPIQPELTNSAESDSVEIFNLLAHQKQQYFPRHWPLGFDDDDDDDGDADSVFLDSVCSTESTDLTLTSLREFTKEMEKVGLAVVEALTCAVGVRSPGLDDPGAVHSLMWISDVNSGLGEKMVGSGRFYPYVVGLHYHMSKQSCNLLTDTGLVPVSCEMGSILVTIGDIAQVWSNGKLKNVRGKPSLSIEEGSGNSSLSMSLLVTLPLESTVSPLSLKVEIGCADLTDNCNKDVYEKSKEERLFNSFSFEDYAWRVYHERVPLKDPLDRYRNKL
ncbi:gibberellin 2-beta-dioxygenase 4-like [Bidens hawaiensis]|uniref:gibberellin 2-beta-dioxygenase 4-like n=1 Tax=Bidens hawaiensis TaxID=980011 RepID=UPI00404B50FB